MYVPGNAVPRIKEFRKLKNWTQNEFAEMVGTSQSALSAYETGEREPMLSTCLRISEVLDVSLEELFPKEVVNHYMKNRKIINPKPKGGDSHDEKN